MGSTAPGDNGNGRGSVKRKERKGIDRKPMTGGGWGKGWGPPL